MWQDPKVWFLLSFFKCNFELLIDHPRFKGYCKRTCSPPCCWYTWAKYEFNFIITYILQVCQHSKILFLCNGQGRNTSLSSFSCGSNGDGRAPRVFHKRFHCELWVFHRGIPLSGSTRLCRFPPPLLLILVLIFQKFPSLQNKQKANYFYIA